MQPLAFAALLAGALLLTSGLTGSSVASTAKGKPDRANAGGPQTTTTGASSSSTAASSPTLGVPNAHGLVNPLPGFTLGRADMGVDASTTRQGAPILAIAPGKVLGVIPNWFKGQPLLYYEVLEGALKGQVIYVAEQIQPLVRPGQSFAAGQAIARYAPSGTGIEIGFGTRSGQTLAQATTGYTEGQETTAGKAFRALLERL